MADVETKETKVVSTPEKKAVEESAPVCEKPKAVEKEVVEAEHGDSNSRDQEDSNSRGHDDSNSRSSENGNTKEATSNGSSEEKASEGKDSDSEEKSTNGTATEGVCSLKRKSVGGDATEVDGAAKEISPKKAKLAAGNDKPAAEATVAQTNGSGSPTI